MDEDEEDDDFEALRRQSQRGSTAGDDADFADDESPGFLASMSVMQRLILAFLFLANGFVVLLIALTFAGIF